MKYNILRSSSLTMAVLLPLAMQTVSAAAAENCANLTSQEAINECYGNALADGDKELNANYREIDKRLSDDTNAKKLLLSAERAWLLYRDSECTFSASGSVGGSIYPTVVASCKAALTNERNKALKAYLNCQEGDTSCPVPAPR